MRALLVAVVLLLAIPAATAATLPEAEDPQSRVRVEFCDRGGISVYVGPVTAFECALDGAAYLGPCPYAPGYGLYVLGQPTPVCIIP